MKAFIGGAKTAEKQDENQGKPGSGPNFFRLRRASYFFRYWL
jgi:hypothetical protein